MNYESFLELVKKRRSIRQFKPEPIPDEYLDKIIEAARWAPSGMNSQPWEFIVVKNKEKREKIVEIISLIRQRAGRSGATGYTNAPVFVILCGDTKTKEAYRGQLADSIFNSSLANAFLYMVLAVTTLGLGAQWVSFISFPTVQAAVKELLDIPEELEIYDMLALGYPDMEPNPRPVRDREEMVHHGYYARTKLPIEP